MGGKENGHLPNPLKVKLAYLNGRRIHPCTNGCDKSPVTCGGGELDYKVKGGLAYDPSTKGSICSINQETVFIIGE